MDKLTTTRRSENMRAIKSAHTKPEMTVRKLVYSMGFRYRLHRKDLPGRPDLVFPSRRKVIFVHGCFWHQHSCREGRVPSSNVEYWRPKLERNAARDAENVSKLQHQGWSVLVVWECEVKDVSALKTTLATFLDTP